MDKTDLMFIALMGGLIVFGWFLNDAFKEAYFEAEIIDFRGTKKILDYTFTFISEEPDKNRSGYTYGNKSVWLVSNKSIRNLLVTCNHEIIHNLIELENKIQEEEIAEVLDDHYRHYICNRLMQSVS